MRPAGERRVLQTLFAAGTGLIVATFTYSMLRSWPTFDPIASATLIGIGLVQVVIYERLGSILRVMERLVEIAEHRAALESSSQPGASSLSAPTHAP